MDIKDLAIRENEDIIVDWDKTLGILEKDMGAGFGNLANLKLHTKNPHPITRRNLVKWLQEHGYKIYLNS